MRKVKKNEVADFLFWMAFAGVVINAFMLYVSTILHNEALAALNFASLIACAFGAIANWLQLKYPPPPPPRPK